MEYENCRNASIAHRGSVELPDDDVRLIYQLANTSPIVHADEEGACIGISRDQGLCFLTGITSCSLC